MLRNTPAACRIIALHRPSVSTRAATGLACMSKTPSQQPSSRLAAITRTFSSTSENMSVKKIFTSKACPPAGPYTQAIVAGHTVYVSGQIPCDAQGKMVEGNIADKTRQCIMNIKAIVEEAGGSLGHVVKCNVFLDDMANFSAMNAEYEKHFSHLPARSCVAVRELPKKVPVEIECIAFI